jgi:putative oxidoreductase
MTPSTSTQNAMTLVGRALIALLFLPSGFGKIGNFAGLVGYIAAKGVPLPEVCAAIALVAEVGLGLALLFGIMSRWSAFGLAIYVAVITPIFHNFWTFPAAQQAMQQQAFYKNIAVVGGLLVLTAFGPGGWSVDGKRGKA